MKDFLGREIKVGDYVVATYGDKQGFVFRYVIGKTPKKVKVIRVDQYKYYRDTNNLDLMKNWWMEHRAPELLIVVDESSVPEGFAKWIPGEDNPFLKD